MDISPAPSDKQHSGCMIVVVGPSGAGKDTLLARAATHFAGRQDVIFTRRVITRDAAAGGEDHDGVCDTDFEELEAAGHFAVSWHAHGLRYGIPAETQRAVKDGAVVIANGSRSALDLFRQAYPSLLVVNITARREILAARLHSRGRESLDDILARLERSALGVVGDYEVATIDNSGDIATASQALIDILGTVLKQHCGWREK